MGWRNWPSWLKGGMMLVIIFIILVLIQGIDFGQEYEILSPGFLESGQRILQVILNLFL